MSQAAIPPRKKIAILAAALGILRIAVVPTHHPVSETVRPVLGMVSAVAPRVINGRGLAQTPTKEVALHKHVPVNVFKGIVRRHL